jgi:glycerol-3-phosphate dehydrogenase (NAD(P)+)
MTLAIIGAGSWGTALAIVLAPKFERVRLWVHEQDLAAHMNATRENDIYLKGFELPRNVEAVTDLGGAIGHAGIVMGVMPAHHARGLYMRMVPHLNDSVIFVSATKGIETGTLLRMSEVISEVTHAPKIAILSGPTFAREVARGEPAAVVIASSDLEVAASVQTAFSGPSLRLYTNQDPIGVEVGAALKNIIAIGAGVCQGLGLGNNTIAALITRGLAEISRPRGAGRSSTDVQRGPEPEPASRPGIGPGADD